MFLAGLLPMACSSYFLIQPRDCTTYGELDFPYQLLIKKMPPQNCLQANLMETFLLTEFPK